MATSTWQKISPLMNLSLRRFRRHLTSHKIPHKHHHHHHHAFFVWLYVLTGHWTLLNQLCCYGQSVIKFLHFWQISSLRWSESKPYKHRTSKVAQKVAKPHALRTLHLLQTLHICLAHGYKKVQDASIFSVILRHFAVAEYTIPGWSFM